MMPDERFDSYEKFIDSFIAIIDDIDFSLIFFLKLSEDWTKIIPFQNEDLLNCFINTRQT